MAGSCQSGLSSEVPSPEASSLPSCFATRLVQSLQSTKHCLQLPCLFMWHLLTDPPPHENLEGTVCGTEEVHKSYSTSERMYFPFARFPLSRFLFFAIIKCSTEIIGSKINPKQATKQMLLWIQQAERSSLSFPTSFLPSSTHTIPISPRPTPLRHHPFVLPLMSFLALTLPSRGGAFH